MAVETAAKTSYPTSVNNIEEAFYLLRSSPKPQIVGLLDHHNTMNNVGKIVAPLVQRRLDKKGHHFSLEYLMRYPLFEHPHLTDIPRIQREVMMEKDDEGKTLDDKLELIWRGGAGLKILSSWDLTIFLTTGTFDQEQLNIIWKFYQDYGLISCLEGIIGKRDPGQKVWWEKEINNRILQADIGFDDSLKTCYYGYAQWETHACIIDPNFGGEEDLCAKIETDAYQDIIKDVLGSSSVKDKKFQQFVHGPFADIGSATKFVHQLLPDLRKQAERKWHFRKSLPEDRITRYIDNYLSETPPPYLK